MSQGVGEIEGSERRDHFPPTCRSRAGWGTKVRPFLGKTMLRQLIFAQHSYFQIVKNPMDLGTMGEKLKQGKYHDRFVFEQDFRLMISNAKLYNLPGSYAHNQAINLDKFFTDCKFLILFSSLLLICSQCGHAPTIRWRHDHIASPLLRQQRRASRSHLHISRLVQ